MPSSIDYVHLQLCEPFCLNSQYFVWQKEPIVSPIWQLQLVISVVFLQVCNHCRRLRQLIE
jgi:hypothetical protein